MGAKVNGGGQVRVQSKQAQPEVKKAPEVVAQSLGERTLKKSGKVSSFTSTNAAFQPGQASQVPEGTPSFRAGSAASLAALQSGGQLPTKPEDIEAAEQSVAFNSGRDTEWSLASLSKNPKKFLRDVVQLDGRPVTTADQSGCGPTALLMGMIAGRPDSLKEFASKLVNKDGSLNVNGQGFASKLPASFRGDLQESLARLATGKAFTPADVTVLAEAMQSFAKQNGADSNDLKALAKSIESLGVKLPKMELQLFGNPDGSMGHWRVESNGTQFNPWPNKDGQSTQLPAKSGLADGVRDGAGWVRREQIPLGSR